MTTDFLTSSRIILPASTPEAADVPWWRTCDEVFRTSFIEAQAEMRPAEMLGENNFSGYRYARLDDIVEVIRQTMNKKGLGYVQEPQFMLSKTLEHDEFVLPGDKQPPRVIGEAYMTTTIFHATATGEIRSTICVTATTISRMTLPQTIGSWITYLRKYHLASMFGVATSEFEEPSQYEQPTDVTFDTVQKSWDLYEKVMREAGESEEQIEERKYGVIGWALNLQPPKDAPTKKFHELAREQGLTMADIPQEKYAETARSLVMRANSKKDGGSKPKPRGGSK